MRVELEKPVWGGWGGGLGVKVREKEADQGNVGRRPERWGEAWMGRSQTGACCFCDC